MANTNTAQSKRARQLSSDASKARKINAGTHRYLTRKLLTVETYNRLHDKYVKSGLTWDEFFKNWLDDSESA